MIPLETLVLYHPTKEFIFSRQLLSHSSSLFWLCCSFTCQNTRENWKNVTSKIIRHTFLLYDYIIPLDKKDFQKEDMGKRKPKRSPLKLKPNTNNQIQTEQMIPKIEHQRPPLRRRRSTWLLMIWFFSRSTWLLSEDLHFYDLIKWK